MSKLFQLFVKAYGEGGSEGGLQDMVMKIVGKLIIWGLLTIAFLVLYYILYALQCAKPKTGKGTCILRYDKGVKNIFEYDLSQMSVSGDCGTGNPYEVAGQQADWIDTGFTTNGKQLIVYVDGEYYPWGEKQTPPVDSFHVVNTKKNDGTIGQTLERTSGPAECELSSNIVYQLDDTQETRAIYANQLNQYTGWNTNLRVKNDAGKIIYEAGQQADCIQGVNCEIGNETETFGCVLKNGAGIYMKIGNNSNAAYHIKNYFVPDFSQNCATGGICTLNYKTSSLGVIELVQVPFALPPVLYKYKSTSSKNIYDIRENVLQNLSIITETDQATEYKFTTIQPDSSDTSCVGYDRQIINGRCYKQVIKSLTLEEMQNPNCPESSNTNILLANELCAPQKDQKIWIKPADTCYEDNTGKIRLTFTSGVNPKNNEVNLNNEGIKISWAINLINQLFTPFFGNQKDPDDPTEIIKRMNDKALNNKTVKYCRNDGKDIFYSTSNKDWILKTEKYGISGLKIYDLSAKTYWDDGLRTSHTTTIKYLIDEEGHRNCVIITFKDDLEYQNKTYNDISEMKVTSSSESLIRIANMEDGLFIQVRNAIMKSTLYQIARIMIIVWFIFSFGIGFLNRQKILSKILIVSSDWKRFLILLWCTDYHNYDVIDDLLWPALFRGAQAVAGGIFDAVSGVYGTSLTSENPLDFFDDIISSITSKETFYKLGAIATSSVSFIMFLIIFPLLASSLVDFFFAIVGPIISLGFTLFNIGSIIMLMPVYALLSLFGTAKQKNSFTSSVKMLISEFIHFSFEIGFFGFIIGFLHHYYLNAMNLKICWQHKDYVTLNYIFPIIDLGDWQICNDYSDEPVSLITRFKILIDMLQNIFYFKMMCSIFGKYSVTIADKLANVFAKGGNLIGIKQADKISDGIGKFARTTLTKVGNVLERRDEQKQQAEEMDNKQKIKLQKEQKQNRYNQLLEEQKNRKLNQLGQFNSNVNLENSSLNQQQNNTQNNVNQVNRENETNNINNINDIKNINEQYNIDEQQNLQQNNNKNNVNKLNKNIINNDQLQQTNNVNTEKLTKEKNIINKTNIIDEINVLKNKNKVQEDKNENQDNILNKNIVSKKNNNQNSILDKNIINNNASQHTNQQDHQAMNDVNNGQKEINRGGAGIQQNDPGIQQNDPGIQQNDPGIQKSNAAMQNTFVGDVNDNQNTEQINKLMDKKQQIEKKQQYDKNAIKAIDKVKEEQPDNTKIQTFLATQQKQIEKDMKQQKKNAYNVNKEIKEKQND